MPMAICGKAIGNIQNASRIGFSAKRPRTDANAAAVASRTAIKPAVTANLSEIQNESK